MKLPWKTPAPLTRAPRRSQRMGFTWDSLEERTVLSHIGGLHHLHAAAHVATVSGTVTAANTTGSTTTGTGSTGTTTGTGNTGSSGLCSSSSNPAVSAAQTTLRNDILAILSSSSTTVGQLATIQTTFQTLRTDGLTPSSASALSTFENSLVTSLASGTTLTNNNTLLTQFEALYTTTGTTLTTQQTTDLTAAYNALAAAVTSSNISPSNIATIDKDYAAVLTAEGSTSTSTYPYFNLVTGGQVLHFGGRGGHH